MTKYTNEQWIELDKKLMAIINDPLETEARKKKAWSLWWESKRGSLGGGGGNTLMAGSIPENHRGGRFMQTDLSYEGYNNG